MYKKNFYKKIIINNDKIKLINNYFNINQKKLINNKNIGFLFDQINK